MQKAEPVSMHQWQPGNTGQEVQVSSHTQTLLDN